MTVHKVKRPISRIPSHPGELMREILDDHVKLSISEAARRMRISRQALYAVLGGKNAVTADMALRFGRLVNAPPELYLKMQDNYDLWEANRRIGDILKQIEPVPSAA